MRTTRSLLVTILLLTGAATAAGPQDAATPAELVRTYEDLATTILAAKSTEWHLVQSILTTTYGHAQASLRSVRAAVGAGEDARQEVEMLADLVAQLGNEGDAAVGAIRKRLVEGGHHHNVKGEEQGVYDEGFVIVTRKAKKVFLDASTAIARMGGSPDLGELEKHWDRVVKQFQALFAGS